MHKYQPEDLYAAMICIVIMCCSFLFMKNAHADQIYIDGKIEQAKCEILYSEPVQIRCVSKEHTCTFYPETNQHECRTNCFDE